MSEISFHTRREANNHKHMLWVGGSVKSTVIKTSAGFIAKRDKKELDNQIELFERENVSLETSLLHGQETTSSPVCGDFL